MTTPDLITDARTAARLLRADMVPNLNQEASRLDALADELERLRAELLEQCRLHGMGSEREAGLMGERDRLRRELERLRAQVADEYAPEDGPPAWHAPARRLTKWLLCMSYNDSYFGEPAGYLKQCINELHHLLPPERLLAAAIQEAPAAPAQQAGQAPAVKPEPIGYLSEHTGPDGPFKWQFSKTLAGVYRDTALRIIPVYEPPGTEQERKA